MLGTLNLRLIGIIAAVIFTFSAGWFINGWRWEDKYEARIAAEQKAKADAEQEARDREQAMEEAFANERNKRNEEITTIHAQLNDTLSKLRQRPARGRVPNLAAHGQAATGAQLYREDGEFLAGEAARADEVVADRDACYAAYSQAQSIVNRK